MVEINNQTAQTGKKILEVAINTKNLDLRAGISLGSLEKNASVEKAENKDQIRENPNRLPLQKSKKSLSMDGPKKAQDIKDKMMPTDNKPQKDAIEKDAASAKARISQKGISVVKAASAKKDGQIKEAASVAKSEGDKAKAHINNMVAKDEKRKKEEQKAQEKESLIQSLKRQQASKEAEEKSSQKSEKSKVHETMDSVVDKAGSLAKSGIKAGAVLVAKEAIKEAKKRTIDQGAPVEPDR